MVCLLFVEEARVRLCSLTAHAIFLTAVLGIGRGLGRVLLCTLSLAQVSCCATLLLPALYNRLGTWIPSASLGSTLLFEFVIYGGYKDGDSVVRFVSISLSLVMIALFRGDARARTTALGEPVVATALAIEAMIRKACTKCHTSIVLTPILVSMMLHVFLFRRYWWFTGSEYELRRARFSTGMSKCSLLAFLIGQDRSPSYYILDRVRACLMDGFDLASARLCRNVEHWSKKM